MYQNESIRVITGFKQGPLGFGPLILVAPSYLRSHNARYITLKSLINCCITDVNGGVVSALVYIQVIYDIGILNLFRIILQTKLTLWVMG